MTTLNANNMNSQKSEINAISLIVASIVYPIVMAGSFSPSELNTIIESVAKDRGNTFENNTTIAMVNTLVKKEIANILPSLYEMIYPKVGMTANGKYTTNKKIWA